MVSLSRIDREMPKENNILTFYAGFTDLFNSNRLAEMQINKATELHCRPVRTNHIASSFIVIQSLDHVRILINLGHAVDALVQSLPHVENRL